MKLNKLFAIFAVALFAVSCYQEEFAVVEPDSPYNDTSFEEMFTDAKHISIAELKAAFGKISGTGENVSWGNTKTMVIGEDIYGLNYAEGYEPKIIFEGEEVYIKGRVISDDTEGNVYKSLHIQDDTAAIELKLNNNVGLLYKKGSWVYVRLKGLYLGNYRMMLSLGGPPSESYNKVGEHKHYANSNLELQSDIDKHVFAGGYPDYDGDGNPDIELRKGSYLKWVDDPTSVDIITVTPDNYKEVFDHTAQRVFKGRVYGTPVKNDEDGNVIETEFKVNQRELMYGRLICFEGLQCRYAGVPSTRAVPVDEDGDGQNDCDEQGYEILKPVMIPVDKDGDGQNDLDENGNEIFEYEVYETPLMYSGSYESYYPSWLYTDSRRNGGNTTTKPWYHWAFKEEITGRSLYGSVCFAYDMESVYGSSDGVYVVRTSGYSRFARQNVCRDGEKATITAIYGIYAKNTQYKADSYDSASYQLTINSINDIVFDRGKYALMTDDEVNALTTEDMKTVPWIDEYEEGAE